MNAHHFHHTPPSPPARWRVEERGSSLLEVLIALLVLSLGLLGLARMQLENMRQTGNAAYRSQAALLAYDIVDRMRANPGAARGGAYDIGLGSSPGGGGDCRGAGVDCDSGSMADFDLGQWKNTLADLLPQGDGAVSYDGALFTVVIQWSESRQEGDPPTEFQTMAGL